MEPEQITAVKNETLADVTDEFDEKFLSERLGELSKYKILPIEEETDYGR